MIKAIKYIFLLKAAVWAIIGGLHYWGALGQASMILAFLFFVDAVIFFWLGSEIASGKKWIYWFAVFFVSVNILLTIADQLGVVDFAVLIIDVILLGLLIINYKKLVFKNK